MQESQDLPQLVSWLVHQVCAYIRCEYDIMALRLKDAPCRLCTPEGTVKVDSHVPTPLVDCIVFGRDVSCYSGIGD